MKKYLVGLMLGIVGVMMIGSDAYAECQWTPWGCVPTKGYVNRRGETKPQPPQGSCVPGVTCGDRDVHPAPPWYGFCFNNYNKSYNGGVGMRATKQEIIEACGKLNFQMAWTSQDQAAAINQYNSQCFY